jgi:hypothetical protein
VASAAVLLVRCADGGPELKRGRRHDRRTGKRFVSLSCDESRLWMQYSTRLLGSGRVWWQFQQLREYSHDLARVASAEECSGGVVLWRHEQKRMGPTARMTIWNPCVTHLGIQRRAGSNAHDLLFNVLVARHGYCGSWVPFHGLQHPVID